MNASAKLFYGVIAGNPEDGMPDVLADGEMDWGEIWARRCGHEPPPDPKNWRNRTPEEEKMWGTWWELKHQAQVESGLEIEFLGADEYTIYALAVSDSLIHTKWEGTEVNSLHLQGQPEWAELIVDGLRALGLDPNREDLRPHWHLGSYYG